MKVDEFVKKHNLTGIQKNVASSIILSGGTEETTLAKIKGYSSKQKFNNSLACPRCNSSMRVVTLEGGRRAKYCPSDRVTLPLKEEKP